MLSLTLVCTVTFLLVCSGTFFPYSSSSASPKPKRVFLQVRVILCELFEILDRKGLWCFELHWSTVKLKTHNWLFYCWPVNCTLTILCKAVRKRLTIKRHSDQLETLLPRDWMETSIFTTVQITKMYLEKREHVCVME